MPIDSNFLQQLNYRAGNGGNQGGGNQGGGGYQGGGNAWYPSQGQGNLPQGANWQQFQNYYNQVAQANQQYQQQQQVNPWGQQEQGWQNRRSNDDYDLNRDRGFTLSGGTKDMYNGYRKANLADTAAIYAGQAGNFLMNLPGEIAGAVGGDKAKEDWTFDASKFDISDGLQGDDMRQLFNFGLSLPGMIPGGVFEGVEKGYEAITGTPVQEHREAKDGGFEIADYTLDASQRAAAGVDAFIDVAGTFTGGAGRVVGQIGKQAAKKAFKEAAGEGFEQATKAAANEMTKTANRIQKLDNMSKGMIERAWEGVGGKKPTGAIGQTVFDMADEGAEEYVQSWAEDIRNKNVDENSHDRAMTGAAWGALGGGLMSVGMRGVRSHAAKADAASATDSTTDVASPDNNEPFTFTKPYDAIRKLSVDSNMMDSRGSKIISDKLMEDRYAPGAAIVKHSGSDSTLNIDDMELGAENLAQIWNNGDRDRQKLAYAFGVDEKVLDDVFNPPVGSNVDQAAVINQLIANKGDDVEVVIGRNPDTKNGGFRMNLARVVNGQSLKLHPMAYAITGSDIDGDQSSVYFDPDRKAPGDNKNDLTLNVLGYASQMLLDPEGGTNVDWWYSGFDKFVSANRDKIDDIVSNELQGYTRKFEYNGEQVSAAEYFQRRISDAIDSTDNKKRNLELSRVFTDLGNIVDDMNNNDEFEAGTTVNSGRRIVNSVLKSITNDEQSLITHYVEYNAAEIQKNLASMVGIDQSTRDIYEKQYADWTKHGTLGSNTKAFQLSNALGLISYYNGKDGNPLYRQYGMLRYASASRPVFNDIVTSLGNVYTSESVIQELLRASFRIAQVGESPSDSIEGVIDTLIMAEVYNSSSLATSRYDYNSIRTAYAEAHAKYCKIYNESKKVLTQNGYEENPNSAYKNPLPEINSKEFESRFMRQFNKVFANAPLRDIVDVSKLPESYRDMTWGQFLSSITDNVFSNDINVLIANFGEGTDAARFLRSAYREVGTVNNGIESRINSVINEIKTDKIIDRYKANGNKVDPRDIPAVVKIMELVHEVIDADVSLYLNLFNSNELMQTQLGRMLFSGDPDKMLNALTSVSLYGQFNPIIEDLESGDEHRIARAQRQLQEKSFISPTHNMLAATISQNNYQLLAAFTNLDTSLAKKKKDFAETVGAVSPTANYVVNSLMSKGGEFGPSSLSASLSKAQAIASSYKKVVYDEMLKEVDSFGSTISVLGNQDELIDAFIKSRAHDAIVIPSMDLLWMKIYSSTTLDNKFVEKATNTDAALQMFLANQMSINGNLVSHIDAVTAHEHGTCSSSDWLGNKYHLLSCFTDPNYRQWVFDENTGERYLMTRERLFKSCGVNLNGREPTARQYIAVLKEIPQIAGYLCETKMNLTSSTEQVGVAPGRVGTLTDSFNEWQSGIRGRGDSDENAAAPESNADVEVDMHMDRALKIVRSHMFNDPRAHKIVTWLLDHDTLSGNIDMRAGDRDVQNKYDALARYIYYRASRAPITGESSTLKASMPVMKFKRDRLRKLCTDLWNMVGTANKQLVYEADLGDTALRQMVNTMSDIGVMRTLKDQNADLEFEEASVSTLGGEYRSTFDMLQQSYNETYEAAMMIVLTMADGDIELLTEMSTYSGNANTMKEMIRSAVVRRNRSNGVIVSDDDIDAEVSKIYANAKNSSNNIDVFDGINDKVLTKDDFKDRDTLVAKLRKLYEYDAKLLDGIDGDADSYFNARTEEAREAAKKLIINTTNQNVISHTLRHVAQMNMMPVNENALQSYHEAMTDLDDMVDEYTEELRGQGIFTLDNTDIQNWYKRHNYSSGLPRMDFLDRTKQQSISNQKIMDMSGGNPALVGTNGAMAKKVSSLGHLSQSYTDMDMDYITEITARDLREYATSWYSAWHAIDGDGNYVPVNSPAFIDWINSLPEDQVVQAYNPEDNPHGLATRNISHREYDPNSEYHRVTGIIGRIIDFTQEAMVLKAKKTFKTVSRIVTGKEIKNAGDDSVVMDSNASMDEFYETYREVFMNARKDYEMHLFGEFSEGGSLDGLGFNQDQAMILSQFLTPGMIVTYRVGNDVNAVVMDADVFFGANSREKFEAVIKPILENGGTVESAEVMYVTLEEAATRVGKAVAYASDAKGGRKLNKKEAEAAANSAMADWSDHQINYDADIRNLTGQIPPVGYAYRGKIVAPDSNTGFQYLLDEQFNGSSGSSSRVDSVKVRYLGQDSKEWANMKNFGAQLGLVNPNTNTTFAVAKVWRPVESSGYDSNRRNFNESLGFTTIDNDSVTGPNVVGIVTDPTKINEAIAWGKRTHNAILVDAEFIDEGLIAMDRTVSNSIIWGGKNGSQVSFRRIDPWKVFEYRIDSANDVTSSAQDRDTSNLFTVAMASSSMVKRKLGDAEIEYFPTMDKVTLPTNSNSHTSVDDYFPTTRNNFNRQILNRSDAKKLLSIVATQDDNGNYVPVADDSVWKDAGIILDSQAIRSSKIKEDSTDGKNKSSFIKRLVVEYLVDINQNDRPATDPSPSRPARSTVACFITDGISISPVLYPDTMPSNIHYAETVIENGQVRTYYSGTTPFTVEGRASSTKLAIMGETFKGMLRRSLSPFNPKLGNGRLLDMLASADTEEGRVKGIDESLLKNALHYEARLRHGSLFYNGSDFNDHIKNNPDMWDEEALRQFSASSLDRDFWETIVFQKRTLTDDQEANNVISNVIRACLHYNVNPIYLLSTYRLEMDSKGELHRINTGSDPSNPNSYKEVDFQMIYGNMDSDQILRLYHAIDPTICPNGNNDTTPRENYLFDRYGNVLVQLEENGDFVSVPVRYGFHRVLEESTEERTPTGRSAIARQHQYRRALDKGYLDSEIEDALDYEAFIYGNYDRAINAANEARERKRKRGEILINKEYLPQSMLDSMRYRFANNREIDRISRDKTCIANTMRETRMLYSDSETDDKNNPVVIEPDSSRAITEAYDDFIDALNFGKDSSEDTETVSFDFVNRAEMFNSASSYVEGSDWYVYEGRLASSIREMADNLRDADRPMPVKVKFKNTANINGRYCIPVMTPEMVDIIWEKSAHIRNYWGTKKEFIDGIKEEQKKAEQAIGSMTENTRKQKSRKSALSTMARSAMYGWHDKSALQTCYDDFTFQHIANDNNIVASALASGEQWTDEQRQNYLDRCAESDAKLQKLRDYLTDLNYNSIEIEGIMGNITGYSVNDDAKTLSSILNNAAELSKAMAILNPLVTVANVTDRTLHQGIMNAAIHLGHKLKIGPYTSTHWLNQDIIKKAVNDPLAIRVYASYRAAEFNDEEKLFIAQAVESRNLEAINGWLDERKSKMTWFQRGVEWAYNVGSGGNIRLKGQMKNFVNQFVIFAEEDGQDFWFVEDPTITVMDEDGTQRPVTYIEGKLQSENGFTEFFLECIGAKGKTPSYSIAMKAMNAAKSADMAQRSAAGVIVADICRRVPFGKFLMTTCVSRFPSYGINVTGRMLNWIMPISSINYVFTEYMAETEMGQRLGLEETQRYASLRHAITADMCKLGVGGVAMVLFGLSGMIQPPDDEKKWGNIDEWLLMGRRVGESWWVEDILGMALPLACFWTSAAQGKPRLDILTNGIANACYSNPILRCSDVATFLINPGESLISDYNEEIIEYQNALGGPPTFDQYLQSTAFSLGMSWVSQFVTPSIVREWYQSSTPFEKTYKKIYEAGPSGVLTEEGAAGKTVYTTYDDAIKRKLARRNPALALLFSLNNGTGTSYWAPDMPDTVYYDDYQLDATQTLSVEGLNDYERIAKVVDIIGIMQSYDDMNELAATGFHLDYETLTAVAQQVWDNYHAVDEWYYGLQADGQLDYYVLGNGDWSAGKAIAGELIRERDTQKQYWYDFYYQKLKNSPIAASLQSYNRYNTGYARDVNGEVYATGVRKSPFNFLPFTGAPGSLQTMEGTSGYENDWATVSAVTGQPMDQRALVPRNNTNVDMPDLEYWSGDGSGNKYSKQYQNIYGTAGDTSKLANANTTSKSGYPSGGYSRGGGGGGGRSYPRYGGGGGRGGSGGYTPNAYGPSVSLSKTNVSRIMNTDKIINPNQAYLRPDFETKGSREAYKRSDI